MRGLFVLLLVVIVTVDTVRSQARPPTRTKKGKRPARRGDNTDVGMPSGKDVPDGMRFPGGVPPGAAPAAPAAPARAAPMPARAAPPAGNPPPPAFTPLGVAPPPAFTPLGVAPKPVPAAQAPPAMRPAGMPPTKTKSATGGRRRNDNPDFGLPSGADYPDQGYVSNAAAPLPPKQQPRFVPAVLTRPAPPPAAPVAPAAAPAAPVNNGVPPTQTRAGGRRWNDNPDFGMPGGADYPDSGFVAPAPKPQPTCQDQCPFYGFGPVCGMKNEYDNACWLVCNNDVKLCDGYCPCPPVAPVPTSPCPQCANSDYDPVCGGDDGEQFRNECEANCNGVTNFVSCNQPSP